MRSKGSFVLSFCLAIALFFAAQAVFASGGKEASSSSQGQPINLIIWHHAGGHKGTIDMLAAEYQKTHPNVTVTQNIYQTYQDAITAVKTALAGQTGCDICVLGTDASVVDEVKANLLVDLTPYYNADPAWKNSFDKWVLDDMTIDGKIIGSTVATNGVQIFYNKNMFQQAGITAPPATLGELEADAAKLKPLAPVVLTYPGSTFENTAWPFWWAAGQIAGSQLLMKADLGTASWQDPKIVQSMQIAQQIIKDFYNKDTLAMTEPQMVTAFLSQKAAMIMGGTWLIQTFLAGKTSFPVGLMRLPAVIPGQTQPSQLSALGLFLGVSAYSQHKEQAVDFLKFMTSGPQKVEYITSMHLLPTGPIDPSVLQGAIDKAGDPLWGAFVQATSVGTIRFLYTPQIWDTLNRGMQKMILGQMTPDELTTQLQQVNEQVGKRSYTLGS